MTIKITVIGLGQIGASFGLALAGHKDKVFRCGHDPEPTRAKKMEKEGAFDKIFFNLPESVRETDIVILALPVDQIEDTLKFISQDLRPGAVVIDTSPLRAGIVDLAAKILPENRHFISMMPTINSIYFDDLPLDYLTPRADLFKNSEMVIATQPTTHPDAVKLAADLAHLVDSKAYFADPAEADGICARVELLPKLVSAALLIATLKQPGWKDGRRFAGVAYQKATEATSFIYENDHPGSSAIMNRENALQAIDTMIASLEQIRTYIDNKDDESLGILLKDVKDDREEWLTKRRLQDWDQHIGDKPPKSSELMGGLFGIRPKVLKKK